MSTNVILADSPVSKTNADPDSAGSGRRHWYEEGEKVIRFSNSSNGAEFFDAKVFWTKTGRNVNLSIPVISQSFATAGFFGSAAFELPKHVFPCMGANPLVSSFDFRGAMFTCTSSQTEVSALGSVIFTKDGKINIYYNGSPDYSGAAPLAGHFAAGTVATVYPSTFSYTAISSLNVEYPA